MVGLGWFRHIVKWRLAESVLAKAIMREAAIGSGLITASAVLMQLIARGEANSFKQAVVAYSGGAAIGLVMMKINWQAVLGGEAALTNAPCLCVLQSMKQQPVFKKQVISIVRPPVLLDQKPKLS